MFPGNQRQSYRADRADRLSQNDDCLTAVTIGDVTRGQRQQDNRRSDGRAGQTERGGRMRSRVNFPFDRDGQHLAAGDGNAIADRIKNERRKSKRRVRIALRLGEDRPWLFPPCRNAAPPGLRMGEVTRKAYVRACSSASVRTRATDCRLVKRRRNRRFLGRMRKACATLRITTPGRAEILRREGARL